MTPLAHRIVKEMAAGNPSVRAAAQKVGGFDDIHCFELSEVMPLIQDVILMGWDDPAKRPESDLYFLPADRTWLEWLGDDGLRKAVHMTAIPSHLVLFAPDGRALDGAADVKVINQTQTGVHFYGEAFTIELSGKRLALGANTATEADHEVIKAYTRYIYAMLAIINSPRLIGRKQHMPHRGLERRLANAKGLVGKFPLHAWTELKLSVADIGKRADGTEYEAHYTGEKCLHFCRSHLRIRNGRLERVSAHWRGNPALGIKRTRYAVTA